MTRRNWMVFAAMLIAASALVLAGCGGDDNGLSAEDMARLAAAETAAASAQETAAAAQMEAATAHEEAEEAKTEAATAHDEAEQAIMDAAAADMRAMDAETALGAAQDEIDDLQAQLDRQAEEAAEYSPSDPGGTLEGVEGRAAAARIAMARSTAAPTRSDGTELVDTTLTGFGTATYMNDPADDTPYNRVRPAAALTTPLAGALTHTGVPSTGLPNNRAEPAMVVRGGVMIVGLEQAPLGQAPDLTLMVMGGTGLGTAMDSADTDAPAVTGFTGVSLMKDGPGPITQTALVYSDAERSVRAFGDVYPNNVNSMGATAIVPTHRAILDASMTAIAVTEVADLDPGIELEHGLSPAPGITMRSLTSMRGSYNGVPGDYSCTTATACSLSLSPGGELQLGITSGGILVFRVDNPEALLADSDFLSFGVWEEVPDSPTLANPGRVRGFVSGSANVYKWEHVTALDGTASFSGAAVGHYSARGQGSHMVDTGRFTATAAVTANFNADADPYVAGNDGAGFSLTGTITDFIDEDGMALSGWLVNLNGGGMLTRTFDIDSTTTRILARPSTDGDIYGTTSGTNGSQFWNGVWDAWMFGGNRGTYPTGVAGRFQASAGTAEPMTSPEGRILLSGTTADQGFAGVVGSFAGR